MKGVPKLLEARMRTHPLGPLALWSTICVRGVLDWARARMRTCPLGPKVDLPMGHDPYEGCAGMDVGPHANLPTGAVGGAPRGARSA